MIELVLTAATQDSDPELLGRSREFAEEWARSNLERARNQRALVSVLLQALHGVEFCGIPWKASDSGAVKAFWAALTKSDIAPRIVFEEAEGFGTTQAWLVYGKGRIRVNEDIVKVFEERLQDIKEALFRLELEAYGCELPGHCQDMVLAGLFEVVKALSRN